MPSHCLGGHDLSGNSSLLLRPKILRNNYKTKINQIKHFEICCIWMNLNISYIFVAIGISNIHTSSFKVVISVILLQLVMFYYLTSFCSEPRIMKTGYFVLKIGSFIRKHYQTELPSTIYILKFAACFL